jgi:hypothetical protein
MSVKVDSTTKNSATIVGDEQERERTSIETGDQESTPDQWWKDQAFLEKAKKEYSKQLQKVYAEVDESAKRINGKKLLREILQERGSLFLSEESLLNFEDFEGMNSLDMIEMACSLNPFPGIKPSPRMRVSPPKQGNFT